MSDALTICRSCGGTLARSAPTCPHCGAPQMAAAGRMGGGDGIERSFGASISLCFSKYVTFVGRAPRAEYWWFVLFNAIVAGALGILGEASSPALFKGIHTIFSLAVLLPGIAVSVRRMHDVDRSGWWLLIAFIPVVGWIIFLVWACTRGTSGPNRFGPENGTVH